MFPGLISTDLEPHGIDGPVGSSFSNYQYPVISKTLPLISSNRKQAEFLLLLTQKTSSLVGTALVLP